MELFTVKKLDGRYSAYPHFSFLIEEKIRWARAGSADFLDINFFTLREWLWNTFGPSKEFRYWKSHKAPNVLHAQRSNNDHWCWDTEFGHQRFYVTEHALALFNLKYT